MIDVKKFKIAIVGSGNVAFHLAKMLQNAQMEVIQIFSRDIEKGKAIFSNANIEIINSTSNLYHSIDLIIFAVSDNALNKEFVNQFPKNKMVVHTSGSIEMNIFDDFENYGVFYPLQTFSIHKKLNYEKIPFCIEASTESVFELLMEIAFLIGGQPKQISSEQRKYIHLAAVFACNFSNYMFHISETILKEKNIDFSILYPLLLETVQKVENSSPKQVQTGPAWRNDTTVLSQHQKMLENHPDFQEIYQILSKGILKNKD